MGAQRDSIRSRTSATAAELIAAPTDREARSPLYAVAMHLGLPLAVSLVVHGAVFGLLATKLFPVTSTAPPVGEYEARITPTTPEADTPIYSWDETPTLQPLADLADDATLATSSGAPDLSALGDDIADGAGGRGLGGMGGGDSLGVGDGALTLLGTGGGAAAPGTGGFGTGAGAGTDVGQAGIWNLRVRADKLVYVVDFSGSIINTADDLKHELKRSVGRLQPAQYFNVIIFYSTGAGADDRVHTESFRPQLVPATAATRRDFFTWIDGMKPRGKTEPMQAMKWALALEPDAVFLFSDGFFDDALVAQITQINNAVGASIHCLVFDELLLEDSSGLPRATEGSRRLRRIADANNGRVKIVTGKDLSRQ